VSDLIVEGLRLELTGESRLTTPPRLTPGK
jgi:hypothetical protein